LFSWNPPAALLQLDPLQLWRVDFAAGTWQRVDGPKSYSMLPARYGEKLKLASMKGGSTTAVASVKRTKRASGHLIPSSISFRFSR
jgi:hypothetical protein